MSTDLETRIEAPESPCPRCGMSPGHRLELRQTAEEIDDEYFWDVVFTGDALGGGPSSQRER